MDGGLVCEKERDRDMRTQYKQYERRKRVRTRRNWMMKTQPQQTVKTKMRTMWRKLVKLTRMKWRMEQGEQTYSRMREEEPHSVYPRVPWLVSAQN
jgi:hypothetical protein